MSVSVKQSPEEVDARKVVVRCRSCSRTLAVAYVKNERVAIKRALSLFEVSNFDVRANGDHIFRCPKKSCLAYGLDVRVSAVDVGEIVVSAVAENRASVVLPA